MASLAFVGGRQGKGTRDRRIADVSFASLDGNKSKRPRIRLGRVTVEAGEEFRRNVERLVEARMTGCALGRGTAEWLAKMPEPLYAKLVKAGLVDARPGSVVAPAVKLSAFLTGYIGGRERDAKPSTISVFERAEKKLIDHFGRDCDMATVTVQDALDFHSALRSHPRLSPNTVRKMMGVCRQFFKAASIHPNPFVHPDIKTHVRGNPAKMDIIDGDLARRMLAAMPDREWRILFALCRWAGLRCPSEALRVEWGDVNWSNETMRVHSPKTEHIAGKECRVIPLFPEVRRELEPCYDPSGGPVLPELSECDGAAIRMKFARILRAAGIRKPREMFRSLRKSCETELVTRHPIHVVCRWLGNDPIVAHEHYLATTGADFALAVG